MNDDSTYARDADSLEVSGGDGVDRRGFLQCMAWAGTGLVWTVTGGILSSRVLSPASAAEPPLGFSFVQISDTHIGFKGEANKDALGTFEQAVARIKALDPAPSFIIHTGDMTHTQKPGAFDTVTEALRAPRPSGSFTSRGRTMSLPTGARSTWAGSADRRAPAGRASTTKACTSSG